MGVDIEANAVDQITGRRNSGSIAQYMEWCASYTSTCMPGIDFKFNMYVQSEGGVVENELKATPSYMLFLSMLAVTRECHFILDFIRLLAQVLIIKGAWPHMVVS